ncbi:MAG TPA: hypothetical protein VM282_19240 [Acidimicrobiales bacterium]|nr:hypothetical protein [Acidimicrobiales bacterium]
METSPSRLEYEGPAPQLFEPGEVEHPSRRLSKAEALVYVRTIRARLHRSGEFGPEPVHHEHRRVA